ncbi:MAG: hypothetical protein WDN66_03845 [Candidatus Saccharibacteria bacterium]
MNNIAKKILEIINSRGFYRFVIIFFVFEAAWIALTAAYPQAFDEQFHFGLIQIYSHHLSPFLSKQPANANQYGAVARDPSYLYHYLMSFPYRLISLVVKRQTYQIISLRFIDIAMFTLGLALFRKILIKLKVSKGLANIAILIFALIPIAPQLAGQINYDDMLFPLVAFTCLLCFRLIDEIKRLKPKFSTISILLIVAILSSLVKYAFLPIFLAFVIFFVFYVFRHNRSNLPVIWHNFVSDFKRQSMVIKTVLIGLLIISAGMFIQRDVVNVIKYHSVDPDCSSILSVDSCKAYSAWFADYKRHNDVLSGKMLASHNIFFYGTEWIYWMWYRLFFAINGPTTGFTNYPPLPLPSGVALIVGLLGVVAVIRYWKEIFKSNAYAVLLLMACLFYAVALMIQGYSTYQYTAVLENMNGRYLLPILLLAGAIFAKAFALAFRKHDRLKIIVACLVVLLFLEGGGILTFIARSDDSWYWQNTKAIKVNNVAQKIAKKVVVRGTKNYNTSIWFFN